MKRKDVLNGLYQASEWIDEIAEEKHRIETGEKIHEKHIQYMLDAIDNAYEIINKKGA